MMSLLSFVIGEDCSSFARHCHASLSSCFILLSSDTSSSREEYQRYDLPAIFIQVLHTALPAIFASRIFAKENGGRRLFDKPPIQIQQHHHRPPPPTPTTHCITMNMNERNPATSMDAYIPIETTPALKMILISKALFTYTLIMVSLACSAFWIIDDSAIFILDLSTNGRAMSEWSTHEWYGVRREHQLSTEFFILCMLLDPSSIIVPFIPPPFNTHLFKLFFSAPRICCTSSQLQTLVSLCLQLLLKMLCRPA